MTNVEVDLTTLTFNAVLTFESEIRIAACIAVPCTSRTKLLGDLTLGWSASPPLAEPGPVFTNLPHSVEQRLWKGQGSLVSVRESLGLRPA